MKKLFYLAIASVIALIVIMTGCSDEPMINVKRDSGSTKTSSSIELALQQAEDFFRQIGATTRTPRQVATIDVIAETTTRDQSDTLLFLVNYANNQGYALLGTNPAINNIYAISPTGHLTYVSLLERTLKTQQTIMFGLLMELLHENVA